jgi:hypothetical protein
MRKPCFRLSCLLLVFSVFPTPQLLAESSSVGRPNTAATPEVQAWREFMDTAREVGVGFLESYPQGDSADRAEALLYLVSQFAVSTDMTLAAADPGLPLLRLGATNIRKWGLDGADAKYLGAAVDPTGSYRLHATLGSARLSAVQVVSDFPHYAAHGSLSNRELGEAGAEITVHFSAQRPADWGGLWLPLPPGADRIVVREYFGDWSVEQPGSWRLERIDAGAPADRLANPAEAAVALKGVTARFQQRLNSWMPWIERTRAKHVNQLVQLGPTGQGLRNNIYGEGWYHLDEDEVLLVELDAPEADLWSIQLSNLWWESLDYIHRSGSLNSEQAQPDPDGRYRIVIAAKDPGYANWLDTGGHSEGAIMYRFQNTVGNPLPRARLLKHADLAAVMPKDAVTRTTEQREAGRVIRRAHAHRRWEP